jgi:hypothetical protein
MDLLPSFGTISVSNNGSAVILPEIGFYDADGSFHRLDQNVAVPVKDGGEDSELRLQQIAQMMIELFLANRKQARAIGTTGKGGQE